jgi:formylglycine-generating enzyme required for sulfatase activity
MKDPSVILRYIPADGDNTEPFYMATHEITNAQYRTFLETTGAINQVNLTGWSHFGEPDKRLLIECKASNYPSCAIKWNSSQKTFTVVQADTNIPATYVSYFGAQSYAESLGAQLPTATQHEYACRARSNNLVPWGDDSEIPNYANVRAGLWKVAKDTYNSKVGSPDPPPPPPVGAVREKDFEAYKTKLVSELGELNVVHNNETTYNTYWPTYSANKPNVLGLYDMIGNVWEWCQDGTQSVICGGSCLAPPKYIILTDPANYSVEFSKPACDVGFRIIVPAK